MASPLDFVPLVGTALNLFNQSRGASTATGALTTGANNASSIVSANGQRLSNIYNNALQNQNTTISSGSQAQQALFNPFVTAGNANAGMLNDGLQPGGGLADPYGKTFSFDATDLQNSPGYQFALQQGQKQIEASKAAMGTRFSGGAFKSAEDYAQGLAGEQFNNSFNQAQSTFNTNANQFETDQANRYNRLQAATQTGLAATGAASTALGQSTAAQVQASQTNAAGQAQSGEFTTENLAQLQLQLAQAQASGNIAQSQALSQAIATGTAALKGLSNAFAQVPPVASPPGTPGVPVTSGLPTNTPATPGTPGSLASNPVSPNLTDPSVNANGQNLANIANGNNGAATNIVNPGDTGGMTTMTGPDGSSIQVPNAQVPNFQNAGYTPAGNQVQNLPGSIGTIAGPASAIGASVGGQALAGILAGGGAPSVGVGAGAGIGSTTMAGPILAGGTEAGAGASGAAAGAATGTTGGASGALSSITGLLSNPITIAVGAAIAGAIIWNNSQAHHTADNFVQTYQNPFANAQGTGQLNKVVDAFDKAFASGQLSKADAATALRQTQSLINSFTTTTQNFMKTGHAQYLVGAQALATMAKNYGYDWSKITGKMQAEIATLQ